MKLIGGGALTKYAMIAMGTVILITSLALWVAVNSYLSLSEEHAQLELSFQTVEANYEDYRTQTLATIDKERKAHNKLQGEYSYSRKKSGELSKRLAKHDFAHKSYKKPFFITKLANAAIERVRLDMESASSFPEEPPVTTDKVPETTTP